MSGYWIAVACAQHVRRGHAGGFMQVCHGKAAPLRRIEPGDGVVYYSPSEALGSRDGLQSFTAIGAVREGEPYRFDMGGGFVPSRRDVTWFEARETAITPLLQELDLTRDKRNWGYPFRMGLVAISGADFAVIASAMAAESGAFAADS